MLFLRDKKTHFHIYIISDSDKITRFSIYKYDTSDTCFSPLGPLQSPNFSILLRNFYVDSACFSPRYLDVQYIWMPMTWEVSTQWTFRLTKHDSAYIWTGQIECPASPSQYKSTHLLHYPHRKFGRYIDTDRSSRRCARRWNRRYQSQNVAKYR